MSDFVVDGQPWEPPESAREQGYALTPPTSEESFGALTGETGTTQPLARAFEAGQYEDSWWGKLARSVAIGAGEEQGVSPEEMGLTPNLKPIPAPKLTADDANKKYAPLGPDGQPVKITDQDVPEPVARMLGKAKAEELDREAVLAAYQQNTSWPMRFASGTAAFMMDPINAASVFLPGIGEETALAGLGRVGLATTGIVARTGTRVAAGAVSGAAAQAPLSALRYGVAPYAGQDYELRDAFRDLMYGAAGGAILHAGFGALGDLAKPVDNADAAVRADAMKAGVAQVVSERPVDVQPVIQPTQSPAELVEAEQQAARNGFAQGIPQTEFNAAKEEIYGERSPAAEAEKAGAPKAAESAKAAPEEAPSAIHAEGGPSPRVAGEEASEGPVVPALPLTAAPELDGNLAKAETAIDPAALHPEDQAELAEADAAMGEAQSLHDAYAQAAQCLIEGNGQ